MKHTIITKPLIYSEIRVLTLKMELKKRKFRNLLNEVSRLGRSFHLNEKTG
ncbi:MAG: hypothetical protein JXB48_19220 [Candidatus Latescibacteria bacterium]|nr:hypothetical protein [Candidatus Latescibacterota bacterium]